MMDFVLVKARMLLLAENLRKSREGRDQHYEGSLERQMNATRRAVYEEIASQIEAVFSEDK